MEPNLVSNLLWVADSFLSHGWVVEGGGIPLTHGFVLANNNKPLIGFH